MSPVPNVRLPVASVITGASSSIALMIISFEHPVLEVKVIVDTPKDLTVSLPSESIEATDESEELQRSVWLSENKVI